MDYNFWADVTAVTHATIIVAVIVGLLISFRYKRFRPWEAGALIATVVLWSYFGNCPLTILEEKLRTLAGNPSGITNVGFTPFYANKLLGVSFTSRMVQQTTFFTGGALFAASIEWLSPVMHYEIFRVRRFFRKTKRKFA